MLSIFPYEAFYSNDLIKRQRRAAQALVTVPIDFSVVLPQPEATTSVSPSSFWRVPMGKGNSNRSRSAGEELS